MLNEFREIARRLPVSGACCAILLAGILLPATSILAQTASDKLKFCEAAGNLAVAVTAARDVGTPMADSQKLVVDMVKDPAQRAMFDAIVTLTYAMDGVEGPLMREVTLQMCQKKMGLK